MGLKQYKESKMKIFGTRLREVRKSKKITQIELANILEIGQSAYAKWENDRTELSFENLIKLADLLEVTLDWLFGRE